MANKESTRYYSQIQEEYVARQLDGKRISNSGAGRFDKSDVVVDRASMSVECKTSMQPKSSFSIKKDWIIKHKEECFFNRLDNPVIAISFEPEGKDNYYLIDQKLMSFLTDKLEEYYKED